MTVLEYARHADGAQVAFRVVGNGERTIVYVPGMLYPIEVIDDDPPYARFIDGLASMGRVVIVERRGIGASDAVDWDADVFNEWAADVVCVLDALGVERAAIIGYTSGGRVALATAALHPERVDAAIALHAGVAVGEIGRTEREALRVGLAAAVDRDAEVAASMRMTTDPSRADDRNYQEWFERGGRLGAGPQTASRFWQAVLADSDDFVELVATIRAPALVMHRTDQVLLPTDASRALAAAIPTGEFRLLTGGDLSPNSGDVAGLLAEISQFLTGETYVVEPDRPLRALLFTDLVGSTETLASVGDARWSQILDHHDGVVRKALDRRGGRIVKSTGDGVLAVFDNASRALNGALDVRNAIANTGLDARMGVHVAEIELRGDDVAGLGVHLAARLMGTAGAGDIVVSSAVVLVAAGAGFSFEPLGSHVLKGIDQPVNLHRLLAT